MRRNEIHFLYTVEEVQAACEARAQEQEREAEKAHTQYEQALADWRARADGTASPRSDRTLQEHCLKKATEYRRWGTVFGRLHGDRRDGKVALHMDDIEYFGLDRHPA